MIHRALASPDLGVGLVCIYSAEALGYRVDLTLGRHHRRVGGDLHPVWGQARRLARSDDLPWVEKLNTRLVRRVVLQL